MRDCDRTGIRIRFSKWEFICCPNPGGRGWLKEAGRAVIALAFDTLGAKSLFAGHHPANAASQRLIEKLGFHFTHQELYPPTGLNHPSYLLLNPQHACSE